MDSNDVHSNSSIMSTLKTSPISFAFAKRTNFPMNIKNNWRSETVRRAGDSPEEEEEETVEAQPKAMPVATRAHQNYPTYIVGHAKRQGLGIDEEPVHDVIRGIKRRRGDSFDFENTYCPRSYDHLPHPSKLRKCQERRAVKKSHAVEKHMCIDYHLSQLRQRNQKYQLCKEEQASSPVENSLVENTEETKLQEPDVNLNVERDPTHDTPWWTSCSVSEHLPQLNLPNFHRKQGRSPLYTTGRVLLGSASVEQLQEEERWFRKLWRPKIKTSKHTEE